MTIKDRIQQTRIAGGWAGNQYLPQLFVRYNLTKEGFLNYWRAQNGKCAGCLEDFAHPWQDALRLGLKPEIDHDKHKPRTSRGLLCRRCNDFLGKVDDDIELLKRLITYLQRKGD